MKTRPLSILPLLFCAMMLISHALTAQGQDAPKLPDAPDPATHPEPAATQTYRPPSLSVRAHRYMMDSIGPYPILMATATAAVDQGTDSPPEWGQGAGALAQRFGSNMGVNIVGNTTRFGLAALLKQDTQYYRCRCTGVYRRSRHAILSAVIARRLRDGGEVFSIPDLVAPYVATTTETYGWYPSRFGAKDAFRMGNYNLLGSVTSNLVFELMPHKVWDLLGKVHMDSRRVSDEP